MKQGILFVFLIVSCSVVKAQSEWSADTLHRVPTASVKEFGGFLLDMNLINFATTEHVSLYPDLHTPMVDYSRLFRLSDQAIYSRGFTSTFSPSTGWGYLWGTAFSSSDYLQMGSFRLNNGLRLNTYGDYNKDGYRVLNPSVLPWERNNFHGAFELKSANGSFGIRVEVQQGRHTPF